MNLDDVLGALPAPVRTAMMRPALRCVAAWDAAQAGEFGAGVPLAREAVRSVVNTLADADETVQDILVAMQVPFLPSVAQQLRDVAMAKASPEVRAIARGAATFLLATVLELGVSLDELRDSVDRAERK